MNLFNVALLKFIDRLFTCKRSRRWAWGLCVQPDCVIVRSHVGANQCIRATVALKAEVGRLGLIELNCITNVLAC